MRLELHPAVVFLTILLLFWVVWSYMPPPRKP
jgi:hypothetical protein